MSYHDKTKRSKRGPDNQIKIYYAIYQKQDKKKFPTIRFYNLFTKKNVQILTQ
jgi:hypothetical protein